MQVITLCISSTWLFMSYISKCFPKLYDSFQKINRTPGERPWEPLTYSWSPGDNLDLLLRSEVSEGVGMGL